MKKFMILMMVAIGVTVAFVMTTLFLVLAQAIDVDQFRALVGTAAIVLLFISTALLLTSTLSRVAESEKAQPNATGENLVDLRSGPLPDGWSLRRTEDGEIIVIHADGSGVVLFAEGAESVAESLFYRMMVQILDEQS